MLKFANFVAVFVLHAWTAAAGAQQTGKASPVPGSIDDHGFPATVAREIYKIIPGNPSSFGLIEGEASNPVFPGKAINDVEQVECERTAGYKMIGFANVQGQINVAVCNKGQQVQDIASTVQGRLETYFRDSKGPKEDLRTLGWYYTHAKLNDRLEFHYFPLVAMGHGVLTVFTGVVFDKLAKRAVVVQISNYPMCAGMRSLYRDAPLCTAMVETLEKLAGGIALRFATGS